MSNLCPCGRPSDSTALCVACHHDLQVALGDISSHWVDLDTVKGRQTRYGGQGGRGGSEKPLPVDARFLGWEADGSRLQDAVKNTIGTWGRIVMEERAILAGPTHDTCLHISCSITRRSRPPRDDVASVCRYLLGHADWIRTQHWAPEMLDELTYTAEQLRRMVDRPQDRECIGHCDECGEMLYRQPKAHKAKCRHCGTEYFDANERRLGVMAGLSDRCLTAAEIEIAFTDIGNTPLTAARVRKWVQRDRLKAKGHAIYRGRELPTYLVADVANLLAQDSKQKAG